jgi:hypothetical protein
MGIGTAAPDRIPPRQQPEETLAQTVWIATHSRLEATFFGPLY